MHGAGGAAARRDKGSVRSGQNRQRVERRGEFGIGRRDAAFEPVQMHDAVPRHAHPQALQGSVDPLRYRNDIGDIRRLHEEWRRFESRGPGSRGYGGAAGIRACR